MPYKYYNIFIIKKGGKRLKVSNKKILLSILKKQNINELAHIMTGTCPGLVDKNYKDNCKSEADCEECWFNYLNKEVEANEN